MLNDNDQYEFDILKQIMFNLLDVNYPSVGHRNELQWIYKRVIVLAAKDAGPLNVRYRINGLNVV